MLIKLRKKFFIGENKEGRFEEDTVLVDWTMQFLYALHNAYCLLVDSTDYWYEVFYSTVNRD
jgi:hypothetical protein